jgi:hypothetical protein
MMRVLPPLTLIALVIGSNGVVRAEPAPLDALPAPVDAVPKEPDANELAERWFRQIQGFDALEAYEARVAQTQVEFVVARRWREGRVQVLIDVREPREYAKFAFLFFQNRDRSDDLFAYLPFWRRVKRLPAAQLEGGLLAAVGKYATLADMRPVLPGEAEYERLPDSEVDGEACWTIQGRPTGRWLGFDRIELVISKRTGVALRTEMHKRSEVRRLLVSPKDVRMFDGRYLPTHRRLEVSPGDLTAEIFLRNLMIDPPLPDQLFSKQSLLTQRFPTF